jgi:cell wall-associated NlpC family hydrolase
MPYNVPRAVTAKSHPVRAIAKYGAVLALLCYCLTFAADSVRLVVTVPVANLYSAAAADSDVVSQAIYGSNVVLLEEKPPWAKVQTSDHYSGWLSLDEARRLSNSEPAYAGSGEVLQVTSLSANLYRETDVTAHRPLLTVPYETQLELLAKGKGDDDRWLQVRLPDGQSAWIQRGDVDANIHPVTINESIQLAKRFMGVTYTWGGRSSFGFDCSGFTQMLVRSRGINMPRDADLQAAWDGVITIERKHLRAGDLLFFGSSPEHIAHTGMFIGHGQFIHDTTNGHPGVQISRLNDQPWSRLLVACRRVK